MEEITPKAVLPVMTSTAPVDLETPSFTETIESTLQGAEWKCPICLDAVADPVTIVRCHHSFCFACLQAWFLRCVNCPLCKEKQVDFIRNINPGDFVRIELWRCSSSGIGIAGKERGKKRKRISEHVLMQAVKVHRRQFKTHSMATVTMPDTSSSTP